MSRVAGNFGGSYYNSAIQQNKRNSANKTKNTDHSGKADKTKQPQLSKAAQALLEKLRKQYGNMDIMVADYSDEADAREILARGTKDVSVLFSSEELEKMAADESVEEEYMGRVQNALDMSDEISKKYGLESMLGKDSENGSITKIGVSFNSDGTTTYFAELEKSSEQQKERLDKTIEKHAEEKRAAQKEKAPVKKTTVHASSLDELFKKITEIDWSKISEETKKKGGKFDYSI